MLQKCFVEFKVHLKFHQRVSKWIVTEFFFFWGVSCSFNPTTVIFTYSFSFKPNSERVPRHWSKICHAALCLRANLHPVLKTEPPSGKPNARVRRGCPQTTPIKVTAGWSLSHLAAGASSTRFKLSGGSKQPKVTEATCAGSGQTLPAWCALWTLRRGCCRCSEPAWCRRTARPRRL